MVFCKHVGIASDKIIAVVTLAMMLEIFSILFWGWLSDRIGRKTIYYIGVIGLLLTAFPFFSLLASGNFSLMMLAMMLGLPLCHGAMIAAQPCIMSELFPVEVRYTGLALGHEIGAVISGGISPMIAVALLLKYDHWWPISVMLLGFALVALIALLSIKVSPRALSSRTAS